MKQVFLDDITKHPPIDSIALFNPHVSINAAFVITIMESSSYHFTSQEFMKLQCASCCNDKSNDTQPPFDIYPPPMIHSVMV